MTDTGNHRYLAEFIDGPLEGTTETRVLIDGEYSQRFGAMAAVEGLESTFWYRAVDDRDVEGELHVRYAFDASASDPLEGDGGIESIEYP